MLTSVIWIKRQRNISPIIYLMKVNEKNFIRTTLILIFWKPLKGDSNLIIEDVAEESMVKQFLELKKMVVERKEIRFNGIRIGDYTNEKFEFIVERKKQTDFLASVLDGRYLKQLANMAEFFPGPKFLLFEGDWDGLLDYTERVHGNAIRCLLISSRYKLNAFNIQWIQTWCEESTAQEIIYLDKYAKASQEVHVKVEQRWSRHKDKRIPPLLCVDNLGGEEKAMLLLKKYGSLYEIVSYAINNTEEMIKELKGTFIGRKTIESMVELYTSFKELNSDESRGSKKCNSKQSYAIRRKRAALLSSKKLHG